MSKMIDELAKYLDVTPNKLWMCDVLIEENNRICTILVDYVKATLPLVDGFHSNSRYKLIYNNFSRIYSFDIDSLDIKQLCDKNMTEEYFRYTTWQPNRYTYYHDSSNKWDRWYEVNWKGVSHSSDTDDSSEEN